ncbi:hypothetical protein BHU61_04020 [Macrococcus epidermidis]|uniref:FeS cluster biogenesis domain-containing protein n=1 Tax=Macrococcus epidermidis TaxID=1902580 RepID=A0A327ZYM3_9STAP|nr:HesB/YadR/YfhF family protein [Macrococcus epidermidis]RAK46634.1 hypothetical protein BHU61_04020 [Macrococcus epidermidis]
MQINLNDTAVEWFKSEFDFPEGSGLKFFIRYGGSFQLKQGYSPGFMVDKLQNVGYQDEKGGLVYFVEETDLWYYKDDTMNVVAVNDEIKYRIAPKKLGQY